MGRICAVFVVVCAFAMGLGGPAGSLPGDQLELRSIKTVTGNQLDRQELAIGKVAADDDDFLGINSVVDDGAHVASSLAVFKKVGRLRDVVTEWRMKTSNGTCEGKVHLFNWRKRRWIDDPHPNTINSLSEQYASASVYGKQAKKFISDKGKVKARMVCSRPLGDGAFTLLIELVRGFQPV